jgi:hypothetical protein
LSGWTRRDVGGLLVADEEAARERDVGGGRLRDGERGVLVVVVAGVGGFVVELLAVE